ncbi:aldolase/citrate lyase family protein [Verrucomicrobia bacterium]|jgi:4-hydroxy-2-oxoheptanedioate aldolase|nr:2-dehydro-3-deoxyglucarate aldolase [Verrucomicrobiota bacterium]MDA7658017.1 aldolase/citrate lyase family protein [Verrucomicrobiota bacterium]MDA7667512.1 aldolase/citrate lyase family protein [bacterium]MDB4798677.1 aldolase/citrate lyase family protein [Verrucomicrobiota bacterium]
MQSAFKSLRNRVLNKELLSGTFINLGSSITTEIAGRSGLDWLLIDLEHGAGDDESLVYQLQAASATPAAPIVRIANNDPWRFKRVLDLGASGIMVPWVSTAEEAEQVASAMRYPPQGIRGVAKLNRASGFGEDFKTYFEQANEQLLTIVQIEQKEALNNLDAIAAVDGIDVLFFGPLDMSVSMGIPQQYDHPDFIAVKQMIAEAASKAGKAAGTLLMTPDQIESTVAQGYSFIALGSDGGSVANGMQQIAFAFNPFRR